MAEETTQYTRYPFQNVKISNITKDTKSVAITGVVISKDTEILSFIIEDGSGKMNIITNNNHVFGTLKEGQVVRVLGKIWGEGEEIEIQSDIIQDCSKLDFELFKKVAF